MTKEILTRQEEIKAVIRLARGAQLPLSRPLIMGILNCTPDSFSDGGKFVSVDAAVAHARTMIEEGADMVDIGGESSRPGADPVSGEEELARVIPVIKAIRADFDIPISIDTYKAGVARSALEAGADIVNDISALRFDDNMAGTVAEFGAPVILMHMLGKPRNMQVDPQYDDCVREIEAFFEERLGFASDRGIDKSRIILDPGIGFGKRLADNIDILANLRRFTRFGLPVLLGASRKSFIGMLHPSNNSAGARLGGSLAAAVTGVLNGAAIVRVHDVAPTIEALKVVQAIRTLP